MTHTDIPEPDKRSFILGMITAFSECVAGSCKRPMSINDSLNDARSAALKIAEYLR